MKDVLAQSEDHFASLQRFRIDCQDLFYNHTTDRMSHTTSIESISQENEHFMHESHKESKLLVSENMAKDYYSYFAYYSIM